MRTRMFTLAVAASLLTAGCLRKETTHTLYLLPDGGVRWTATEQDVYSDEEDAGRRFAEEQAYIGPALIGAHPLAEGLKALSPDGFVDTRVIRDERPFHVVTQARFSRLDRLAERMLKETGMRGTAALRREGDRNTLRVTFDFSRGLEPIQGPVIRLLEESDHIRFVLVEGRFVPSRGFDIADGVRATIDDEWLAAARDAADQRASIDLVLAWDVSFKISSDTRGER